MLPRLGLCLAVLSICRPAPSQVIEFQSNGLKYQTLTRRGVTIMYAHLPSHVRDFTILQVAVSNGSPGPYNIRPVDFRFERADGTVLPAWPARQVVELLVEKGSRNDVIKLATAYENALYGIPNMKSTNGYEVRRRNALAEVSSTKLKAAAAASAIALVDTKLAPGDSTDGAIFFQTFTKQLGAGRLVVRTNTDTFEFKLEQP